MIVEKQKPEAKEMKPRNEHKSQPKTNLQPQKNGVVEKQAVQAMKYSTSNVNKNYEKSMFSNNLSDKPPQSKKQTSKSKGKMKN